MRFSLFLSLIVGHIIASEQNRLRKALLYLFVRYIELPLLRITYSACRGRVRFLTENPLTRWMIGRLVAYPLFRWMDTGIPTPTDRVLELIDAQQGEIAVGPCRCRFAHRACNHLMETDIAIRTGTPAFTKAFPADYRIIDAKEAKRIVRRCAEASMWHMVFVHCVLGGALNEYVICNCCTDGCVPYLANRAFGQKQAPLIAGDHIADLVQETCEACGKCVPVCPWSLRSLVDGKLTVRLDGCMGCGLCKRACPTGSALMKRKPQALRWRTPETSPGS